MNYEHDGFKLQYKRGIITATIEIRSDSSEDLFVQEVAEKFLRFCEVIWQEPEEKKSEGV